MIIPAWTARAQPADATHSVNHEVQIGELVSPVNFTTLLHTN